MKFYLATKLENRALAKKVIAELRSWGWEPSYDWTVHGSVSGEGAQRLIEVSSSELCAIASADLVIVLLPGGRGTHVELGAALALDKMVVIWAPETTLLKDDANTCVFYWHPRVRRAWGPLEHLYKHLLELCKAP